MTLTVGDLYCGAGGFAEGFRQAGFRIKWAIDNSPESAMTFKKNHPGTDVLCEDLTTFDPRRLGRVDAVIGSPPCTQFSLANRGGNGDTAGGMNFVIRFLEAIRELRPKYWIMENVPNLLPHLEALLEDDDFRLPRGSVRIPDRQTLTSVHYGVPQLRRRLFCGDYPDPRTIDLTQAGERLTLGHVVAGLPSPLTRPDGRRRVHDPVYPQVVISESELRCHFEDHRWRLTTDEVAACRKHKTAHRVYGKMTFPDSLEIPARTITSTRTRTSRATIVIDFPGAGKGEGTYRTLTARECASVQGFPVAYQFWGKSLGAVDRMIGNAVPPPVAFAFAAGILAAEGLRAPTSPRVSVTKELAPALGTKYQPSNQKYRAKRRFREVCEVEWSRDCRVELDNGGNQPGHSHSGVEPFGTEWVTKLYLGYAKKFKCYELPLSQVERLIFRTMEAWILGTSVAPAFQSLSDAAVKNFTLSSPDANLLQARWAQRVQHGTSPNDVLKSVDELVDEHLPLSRWNRVPIPRGLYSTFLTRFESNRGIRADRGCPKDLTVRVLGALLCLSIACNVINRRGERLPAEPASTDVAKISPKELRREGLLQQNQTQGLNVEGLLD
jgi:DNA (cytosine-5)-methyltransferase 1